MTRLLKFILLLGPAAGLLSGCATDSRTDAGTVHFQAATPTGAGVVHFQANGNCYFGATTSVQQAKQGAFGTVYLARGSSYNWPVGSGTPLYWGCISTPGGSGTPMPAHMPWRGTAYAGQTVYVQ